MGDEFWGWLIILTVIVGLLILGGKAFEASLEDQNVEDISSEVPE